EDGVTLDAWFVPAPDARGTLLFFHGNAGNISHRLESVRIFHELGLSTLIFDYRGYGQSEGTPSEQGTYTDALAAWRHLTEERAIPPSKIILFGRSMGAAVAAYLADQHTPAGLILESGFTSVPDMAAQIYPWLPVRLLARIGYPTAEYVSGVESPILIAHSPGDEIVPYTHGLALFEQANEPKSFLEMTGGHNDGFLVTGDPYVDGLDAFFSFALSDK
ncbi:MAG: alpha/beta hydrolase, partial [Pseudomonadota bacterium]